MFKRVPLILVLCLMLADAGCSTNRIARPDQWAPATDVQRRTVWTFAWGAWHQDIQPNDCLGPGLAEVTVKSNLGYSLISVMTLGFAVPVTIEWRCAKKSPTSADNF